MRKGFWIAAMGMAFVATAASSCRTEEPERVDGARLYATACARCHGARGEGGPPVGPGEPAPPSFTDDAWQRSRSDEELFATVVAGEGTMPSFSCVFEAREVVAIVGYVRSLEARSLAERATGGAP